MIGGGIGGGMLGCGLKLFRVEVGETMRYRCEYLHVPTSSRILFTVRVPINEERVNLWNSAYEAIAKRYAARWIEQTGIGVDCVPLSVVRVTDKMSVWSDPVVPLTDLYSGQLEERDDPRPPSD